MSTEEASSSSTIRRLCRTFSESVLTTMSSSTVRAHEGTSTREFSTSTTHTRHALIGFRFGAQHSVGVSDAPLARHGSSLRCSFSASRIVEPSGTRTSTPSSVTVTIRRIWPSITVLEMGISRAPSRCGNRQWTPSRRADRA